MPFAVRISQSVQKALHTLPSAERQALLEELVQLARRASQARHPLRSVGLRVALAGYRLRLELDGAAQSLRLVGLTRRAVAPTRLAA
jgi:mRNA-degrading endonuclease RelE of RelBE toxin-antitoxin system